MRFAPGPPRKTGREWVKLPRRNLIKFDLI
jgi:hypothetical protein